MEAARTSETSVDIQLRTRQYIPEDSELFTLNCLNSESSYILGQKATPQISTFIVPFVTGIADKLFNLQTVII
jgi:hypothetical protein